MFDWLELLYVTKQWQDKWILQFGKYILVKLLNNERMAKRRVVIAKSSKGEIKRQVSRFRDVASAFLSVFKTDYSKAR